MKNILNLLTAAIFLISCNSGEKLDRETAFMLLQDNNVFPKAITYNIFTTDPNFAKRMIDAGLEDSGLLTVQRTQKLDDVGKPLISFTQKAEPYLIPQTKEDRDDKIQRVKIADEVLQEVTGIQVKDGGKQATVEFKTAFENITPFSVLSKSELDKEKTKKANFVLYDDGWRIMM